MSFLVILAMLFSFANVSSVAATSPNPLDDGSWELVAHMSNNGGMFDGNGELAPTYTYGTFVANPNPSTPDFERAFPVVADKILFITGDLSIWGIADYGDLRALIDAQGSVPPFSPNLAFEIGVNGVISNTTGNVISRAGALEDPWISMEGDHFYAVDNQRIVWGENDWNYAAGHVALKNSHGGINVYVRAASPLGPESCQDIRDANPTATDGDYVIYPNDQVFTVYCNDMAGSPSEYLSLVNTGGSSNFSQYTAGGAYAGTDAVTHYTKVRLNPNTLLVDINDKTFTTSTGSIAHGPLYVTEMDYATAMDCSGPGSSTGQGNIDLRGTRFAVVDTFVPDGWIPSAGQANFSFDDQVVDLQGGGYCGWISPAQRPAHDPIIDDVAYVLALRLTPNVSPTVDAGGPYSGNEGSEIAMNGATASDPDVTDTLTYSWTVDSALLCSFNNASLLNPYLTCSDNGSYTATLSVEDGVNPTVTSNAAVTVSNVAPTLGAISVDPALVPVNTAISASATFSDPGTADEHSAVWDWGDGTTAGSVSEVAGSGSVNDSHSYSTPGVYTVKLTVTDNDLADSNESIYEYVVVYDPSGGFVTGGGWIDSPAGAYKADETLFGKANFGFVAKYKKGAIEPDGNTQFQFKAGDLNFHSTRYEWLVVTGNKAQFKGEGTINGEGSYMFMISADDDNPDTFRIQIWGDSGIVYDNGSQQSLGGGSIKVHK